MNFAPIKALTIDLDNTVWDVQGPVARAVAMMNDYLRSRVPGIAPIIRKTDPEELRRLIVKSNPQFSHDFSAIRKLMIAYICNQAQLPADEEREVVEEAFEVFYIARSQVQCYDNSVETLAEIAVEMPIVTLTNGNAMVSKTPIADIVTHSINARDVGTLKPEPGHFTAALEYLGIKANECVHMGDAIDDDVKGARQVGMHTIWYNSTGMPWPSREAPPIEVRNWEQVIYSMAMLASELRLRGEIPG